MIARIFARLRIANAKPQQPTHSGEAQRAEYWERLMWPASWERIQRNSEHCQ